MSLGDLLSGKAEKPKPLCVVRLRRSSWADSRGAYLRTDLTIMKRLSAVGLPGLQAGEDVNNSSPTPWRPDTCPRIGPHHALQ